MQHKAVHFFVCKFTLHVLGVNHTHHQEYTKVKLLPPILAMYSIYSRNSRHRVIHAFNIIFKKLLV